MIDSYLNASVQTGQEVRTAQAQQKKILRMEKNPRMGGSVPVWEPASSAKQKIEHNLEQAGLSKTQSGFESALAYQAGAAGSAKPHLEEFGFGDLIDMFNPLHHIPLVGHIYREVTGDEIKPVGNIVGGAIFGGPAGAASGLINTVIKEETGSDLAGNALAMVRRDEPETRLASQEKIKPVGMVDNPETMLSKASRLAERPHKNDLPASLLAFTNTARHADIVIKRVDAANGRTAGQVNQRHMVEDNMRSLPSREPITQVTIRSPYQIY